MTDEKLPDIQRGAGQSVQSGKSLDVNELWASFTAMANNPDIDAEKMRTLYELQKDIVSDQRQEEFNQSKFNAMQDMPTITRDKAVRDKKGKLMYQYSQFKHLYTIVKPILKANGLVLDFDVSEVDTETKIPTLRVAPMLRHVNGYVWTGSYMPVPITAANSTISLTQASKGAVETGKRTVLISCLGITEEEDDLVLDVEPVTDDQRKILEDAQRAAASGLTGFNQFIRGLSNVQKGWLISNGHFDSLRQAAAEHESQG